MILVDYFAHVNKLNKVNGYEKLFFSIGSLSIVLMTTEIFIAFIVFLTMSFLIIVKAKIPVSFYCKLLIIPIVFLTLGSLTLLFSVSIVPFNSIDGQLLWKLGSIYFYLMDESFSQFVELFFVSFGSLTCLYFLILTTPLNEILTMLQRFKVPNLFLEIVALSYRYIFLLFDITHEIYISQQSRLGYSSLTRNVRSLGTLITSLFIKTYKQANELQITMNSRGNGNLFIRNEQKSPPSVMNISLIIIFFIGILVLNITDLRSLQ